MVCGKDAAHTLLTYNAINKCLLPFMPCKNYTVCFCSAYEDHIQVGLNILRVVNSSEKSIAKTVCLQIVGEGKAIVAVAYIGYTLMIDA